MENKELEILKSEIERFKTESLKTHLVKVWADSYTNSDPFGYVILEKENNKVWWMKTQAHQLWEMWQAAKSKAVPEGFVLVPKLSANYLFNKVPELGFKHQDEKDTVLYHLNYMASEFKESAKNFVALDYEKQKRFAQESQEQSHDQ